MKYFLIRLSLVINCIMIAMFLTVNTEVTPFNNWLILTGITVLLTIVNIIVMKFKYTSKERDEIFVMNND